MNTIAALTATAVVAPVLDIIRAASARPAVEHLPPIADLRQLAASVAQHKAPLLILFSTPGCPYCREVRENYLTPRVVEQSQKRTPELLLREVDITSQQSLIDLSGMRVSEAMFAARFDVRVVPVVMLVDQKLRQLADPLVGVDRAGFYEGLLAGAIETARKRMQTA